LKAAVEATQEWTGVTVQRIYVDKGYQGHGLDRFKVWRSGNKAPTSTIRRELRRRSAIEPVIGHMKNDGLLGRNFLKGREGDRINAILCGAGHNFRLLLRWLRRLLRLILAVLIPHPPHPTPNSHRHSRPLRPPFQLDASKNLAESRDF
jgi:transposase, IS5 family